MARPQPPMRPKPPVRPPAHIAPVMKQEKFSATQFLLSQDIKVNSSLSLSLCLSVSLCVSLSVSLSPSFALSLPLILFIFKSYEKCSPVFAREREREMVGRIDSLFTTNPT